MTECECPHWTPSDLCWKHSPCLRDHYLQIYQFTNAYPYIFTRKFVKLHHLRFTQIYQNTLFVQPLPCYPFGRVGYSHLSSYPIVMCLVRYFFILLVYSSPYYYHYFVLKWRVLIVHCSMIDSIRMIFLLLANKCSMTTYKLVHIDLLQIKGMHHLLHGNWHTHWIFVPHHTWLHSPKMRT